MENRDRKMITVASTINLPVNKVWRYWTNPDDIVRWNKASDDWHTTSARNDLRTGGKFYSRMEAKDGSAGFDFEGTYESVKPNEELIYIIGDGRKVKVFFKSQGNATWVSESFETEEINSAEMQRGGWQSILNNFKKYSESKG